MISPIRKVFVLENHDARIMCGIVLIALLFSVLAILSLVVSEAERKAAVLSNSVPTRVDGMVLSVATYRCRGDLNYVLVPRQGDTHTFVCRDGSRFDDTLIITAIPIKEEIDNALD